MYFSVKEMTDRLKSLRNTFTKALHKKKEKKSGSGGWVKGPNARDLRILDLLGFLTPYVNFKGESKSSMKVSVFLCTDNI